MRPDDAERHPGPGDDARAALAAWRDAMVEPDAANRLINLPRGGADLVEIVAPDAAAVAEALRSGRECPLADAGKGRQSRKAGQRDTLRTELPADVLHQLLRRLHRHTRQEQEDRGVAVLHLAVGLLHWQDGTGADHASPLLLIPVDLIVSGPDEAPRLRAAAGEARLNPALTSRLAALDVTLPEPPAAGLDPTTVRALIEAAIAGRPGWRTADAVVLARLDPAAEEIRRDLIANEDAIVAHPVVRALAAADGTAGAFTFDPIPPDEIDTLAPPEEIPLVLDTDAAQRACVAAAVRGHSFVVDGPPGTGKTQTIATMIGALAHAGKRVLLVSEKAAALRTVRDRLAGVGLGHLIENPGTSGDTPAGAGPAMDEDDRTRLRDLRDALNSYARAVNEARPPLNRSLHDVIGEFARLAGEPEAPAPGLQGAALTDAALERIREAATRLAAAWRPATERGGFRWREVIEREPVDDALFLAQLTLEDLAEATAPNAGLAAAFHLRLPADAAALAEIAAHAAQRPPDVADQWLTAAAIRPIRQAADDLGEQIEALRQATEQVETRLGIRWADLAPPLDGRIPEPPRLDPPAVKLEPLTAAEAKALAGRFAADADELEHQQRDLDRVTGRLGLPDVVMFSDVELVHLIAELAGRPDKPERAWFAPGAQSAVHNAAAALRRHVEAVAAARAEAAELFTDEVLTAPVEELAERFATVHRGARKLLAPHRRDKETVAGLAAPGVTVEDAVAELGLAVAWRRAHEGLVAAERQHADLLGRFWKRLDTDFRAIGRALQTADEALRVTPPEALPAVVEQVSAERSDETLLRIVTEARDVFRHWRSTLVPEPVAAARPELGTGSVQAAIAWMRAQVGPLREVAAVLQHLGDAVGRDLNVAEAVTVIEARHRVLDAEAALAAAHLAHQTALGGAYRGRETDQRALAEAIEWAGRARTLRTGADGPLTGDQAHALTAEVTATDLTPLIEAWADARERIIEAFGPARQVRLATTLDRLETARELLRELRDDPGGQREWFDHLAAREVLAEYGLDTVADYCADHGVEAGRVVRVIERAAYRAWIDATVAGDERLEPLRSPERAELVDEFRRLDAELLADAAAAITRGEPSLALSPAAVSRQLPAEARFDVVIIDEASRMTPAAAVACAYRGTSLIVIGDDAQLPPAPDRTSVLVVANDSGAFTRLGLPWHYRSRHESLIEFADQAFYQGRLISFPAALAAGDDLGVELFADGDVAARVRHHLDTRPGLSLGVVTLTAAQADALAEELPADVFVRCADAVQGDERDVIILAPGDDLGAAGGPTGARRLNVAITRARQRVEVVTAIRSGARDEPAGEGERRLAAYLDHAEHARPAEGGASSTFEDSVLQTITGWGYPVTAQVGAGRGRVEMAVRTSGRYVLGIRCDGPAYRLASAARDRDRVHDQVLHARGWHLHRVWSVAWYYHREEEEARLRVAIENALATPEVFAVPDDEALSVRSAQPPEWALPYARAVLEPLPAGDHDALVRAVEKVAEVEGPVHVATLTARLREASGAARVTPAFRAAVETAVRASRVDFDGSFVTAADPPIPAVRVPADGVTRKPDQVAEPELQLALEYLVLDAGLVERDDLLAAARRLFGWSRDKTATPRLDRTLEDLVAAGRLIAHRNGLIAAPADDLLDLPDVASLPHRQDSSVVRV